MERDMRASLEQRINSEEGAAARGGAVAQTAVVARLKDWADDIFSIGRLPQEALPLVEGPTQQPSLSYKFDFDAFRKANSATLQAHRMRVLLPPDRVPMAPPRT